MKNGKVKWFNTARGFGFITGDDGNEYFVHYSDIVADEGKFLNLKEGWSVTFDVVSDTRGEKAVNVKKAA